VLDNVVSSAQSKQYHDATAWNDKVVCGGGDLYSWGTKCDIAVRWWEKVTSGPR
jgi:hypothetical protein